MPRHRARVGALSTASPEALREHRRILARRRQYRLSRDRQAALAHFREGNLWAGHVQTWRDMENLDDASVVLTPASRRLWVEMHLAMRDDDIERARALQSRLAEALGLMLDPSTIKEHPLLWYH